MAKADNDTPPNRCRLILALTPVEGDWKAQAAILGEALGAGDVASVILSPGILRVGEKLDGVRYFEWCRELVPVIQAADAAAICVGDTQAMGRANGDGYLVHFGKEDAVDLLARFSPQKSVGLMNIRDRHRALEAGELNPDFVFFGSPEGDIKPQAHPKNVALGEWWSQMIEIPCVVMAGTAIESVVEVAQSGADFVAAGLAVFAHVDGAAAAVEGINALLDEHAPEFETMIDD